jgi:uncharacterized integral membrane protein
MSMTEDTTLTRAAPAAEPAGAGVQEPADLSPHGVESRSARFGRKARRTRLHLYVVVAVVRFVFLVALIVANTRQVKLSWVVGSSHASLVWIVLFSAILGWLLGLLSGAIFRWRTRGPRA